MQKIFAFTHQIIIVNIVRFHQKICKIQHYYFYQKNSDLETQWKNPKIYPSVLFIVAKDIKILCKEQQ